MVIQMMANDNEKNQTPKLFENRIEKLPKYLTSLELSHVLNVSEHTIRSWRKFRIITPIKFGRSVRWLLQNVMEELSTKEIS